MKKIRRWSPYDQDSCTLESKGGTPYGIGAHPAINAAPGAWNLLWLTFTPLDSIASFCGELHTYPVSVEPLAICVGASLQLTKYKGNITTYGALALELMPVKFIEIVKEDPKFLLLVYYGENWLNVAHKRAKDYDARPKNVIQFPSRRVQ